MQGGFREGRKRMLSTGQIFFIAGGVGLAVSLMATIVGARYFHKTKQRLSREIWEEYR